MQQTKVRFDKGEVMAGWGIDNHRGILKAESKGKWHLLTSQDM